LPEDKKKQEPTDEEDEKPEDEEKTDKAETAPKWAIELGAKFDKMTDAFTRFAESKTSKQDEEEEDKKPEDEEKQDAEEEDEKPEDEEKQDEEEDKKPEDEEKAEDKPDLSKEVEAAVTKELAKRLKDVPAEKRSKKIEKKDVLSMEEMKDMPWAEIHNRAKTLGA